VSHVPEVARRLRPIRYSLGRGKSLKRTIIAEVQTHLYVGGGKIVLYTPRVVPKPAHKRRKVRK
jgi:hypothetical protein